MQEYMYSNPKSTFDIQGFMKIEKKTSYLLDGKTETKEEITVAKIWNLTMLQWNRKCATPKWPPKYKEQVPKVWFNGLQKTRKYIEGSEVEEDEQCRSLDHTRAEV